MKHLPQTWSAALVVLVVGCILPSPLRAGEAIQFSNSRSRLDPTAKTKLPGDTDSARLGRMNPLDFVPAPEASRGDPASSRRKNNAAKERANWMVLDKGQLDAKDEARRSMGMREASLEKETDQKDFFFTPLNEKDGLGKSPFARSTGRDRTETGPDDKDVPDPAGKPEEADPHRNQVLGKDGRALGEHTSKELDLKEVLSTSKANSLAPSADRTALMWKDVLGLAGDAGRRRDDAPTADSFRGTATAAPGRGAMNDSFNMRNDLSARAAVSARAALPEAPRSFNMGVPAAAPRAAEPVFSRGPAAYAAPAANDPFGSSAGGAADPYATLRAQAQQPQRSPVSSSYSIPSRPGR